MIVATHPRKERKKIKNSFGWSQLQFMRSVGFALTAADLNSTRSQIFYNRRLLESTSLPKLIRHRTLTCIIRTYQKRKQH